MLFRSKSVGKYTFTIVESMDKAYQSVTAERGTVKMVISKVNAKEVDSTATADFGYFLLCMIARVIRFWPPMLLRISMVMVTFRI